MRLFEVSQVKRIKKLRGNKEGLQKRTKHIQTNVLTKYFLNLK